MEHLLSERTFGIEVEVFRFPYGFFLPIDDGVMPPYRLPQEMSEAFRVAGLKLGREEDSWRFVEDHSIMGGGGIEMLSPRLVGARGLYEVRQALRILKAHGAGVNESCGLHVHHDAADFGCQELRALLELVLDWEPLIYEAIPNNEKRVGKSCRPLPPKLVELLGDCSEEECISTRCLQVIWYGNEEDSQRNERYNETRYHGLNLHSYWFRGTVEFRYMRGTLVGEVAESWILFTHALMEAAKRGLAKEASKILSPYFERWRESLRLLEP